MDHPNLGVEISWPGPVDWVRVTDALVAYSRELQAASQRVAQAARTALAIVRDEQLTDEEFAAWLDAAES